MTLTIPRKSMLDSLRGTEELVFDSAPGVEYHGDTYFDPISRDWTDADQFDLVVIGSGPAGEKGAVQAAYHGYRVAVVERRSQPGGASIAVAGMPVKTWRDAA